MRARIVLTTAALVSTAVLPVAAGPAGAADSATQLPDHAVHQAAQQAKPHFVVSVNASTAELVLGSKVTIKGEVGPAKRAAGVRATLQQRAVGKKGWRSQATVKVKPNGKYRFTDKPTTMHARHYRVVVPAVGKVGQGVSKKVLVTVYRWLNLAEVENRDFNGIVPDETAKIDTVRYEHSLVGSRWGTTGFIDYNLTRRCLTLKTRIGLGDDSDVSATALITVEADREVLYSKSFGLTQSATTSLPLRGVFRLRFQAVTTNPDSSDQRYPDGAEAVIASPQVLCSF